MDFTNGPATVSLTNMLWVEQPVGTGFSTGKVTATSEEEIAADFVKFFKNFEVLYALKQYVLSYWADLYIDNFRYQELQDLRHRRELRRAIRPLHLIRNAR